MKIFVSWSGELSKKIAEELKKWIPCVIQSAEVFFSQEDIEKGQNWNNRIAEELSQCNYGIVCLTAENKNAGWINFEAGAIAKELDARVTALMIDIAPSDIQGPLSSFQSTKIEKDDFFKLLTSINNCMDSAINIDVLKILFDAVWEKMYDEFQEIINQKMPSQKKTGPKENDQNLLEDILQNIRAQSRLLSDPQNLIPKKYLLEILSSNDEINFDKDDLVAYTDSMITNFKKLITMFLEIEENTPLKDELWNSIRNMLNDIMLMLKRQKILDYYGNEDLEPRIRALLKQIRR